MYKVNNLDNEKIEVLAQYMVSSHLIQLSKKYSINELDSLFVENQSKEQINVIFQLLENEILIIDDEKFGIIDDKYNESIFYEIAFYLCQESNNKEIDNDKYKTMYEIRKEALKMLLRSERFTQFRMLNPVESNQIIMLYLKRNYFNEKTNYADIYEKVRLTEYCVKNFPYDIINTLDYFLIHGKEMLPVYKEVYKFIDYYNEMVVGLDYSVVLKIVKKCKKMGITDVKEIKDKLGFTNINSLNKILRKK